MPRVPTYVSHESAPAGPASFPTIDRDAIRSLAEAGRELERRAEEDDRIAVADASEKFRQATDQWLMAEPGDPADPATGGPLRRSGAAAKGSYEAVRERLGREIDATLDGVDNDRQKKLLALNLERFRTQTLGTALQFEADQTGNARLVGLAKATDLAASDFVGAVMGGRANDARIAFDEARQNARMAASRFGPAAEAAAELEVTTTMHSAIISQVATADPARAAKYLETHRHQIDATKVAPLEEKVKAETAKIQQEGLALRVYRAGDDIASAMQRIDKDVPEEHRAAVRAIVQNKYAFDKDYRVETAVKDWYRPDMTPADADTAAAKLPADIRSEFSARMQQQIQHETASEELATKALKKTTFEAVAKGQNPDTIPANTRAQLGSDFMSGLRDEYVRGQSGGTAPNDPAVEAKLHGLYTDYISGRSDEFATTDLYAYVGKTSRTVITKYADLQAGALKADEKQRRQEARVAPLYTEADRTIKAVFQGRGSKTSGGEGQKEYGRLVLGAKSFIDDALDAGRVPTQKDVRQWVYENSLRGAVNVEWWRDPSTSFAAAREQGKAGAWYLDTDDKNHPEIARATGIPAGALPLLIEALGKADIPVTPDALRSAYATYQTKPAGKVQ